jgi:hypothetical protein
VNHGVDFDLAFQLDDVERTAYCIIFSEQDSGQVFDFDSMSFKDK